MTFTPNNLVANRTARLVAEARTPTYTTATPVREHLTVVEVEGDMGGRRWSRPMRDSQVNAYCDDLPEGYSVSDIDHAAKCWCFR